MNKEQKLVDLLKDFDTAMLTTKALDGTLDARPMAIADCSEDGHLWFVTDRHSGKVGEIRADDDIIVTMQSKRKFVTLSGAASLVDDRNKVDELWSESWKVWFPKGKSDPSIILIRVQPASGEYWDNSGLEGLKYLVRTGTAYLRGERAETDKSINASVSM